MPLDFKVIAEAGLTQTEFADLLHAQRVTVNNWVNGRSSPHKMLRERCTTYLKILRVAINHGQLPADIPPVHKDNMSERSEYIAAALKEVAATIRNQKASREYKTAQL